MSLVVSLSHDVDRVRKTYHYLTHDVRQGRWRNLRSVVSGERPYWQFDNIMQMEREVAARSTFFFLEERIRPRLNPWTWPLSFGRYRFAERDVSAMIRRIDSNGWEVALHGSYASYRSGELLAAEKASLEAELGKPVVGIRQHHLNLDVPATWALQRAAGFKYDASFGLRGSGIGYREGRLRGFTDPGSGMFVIPLTVMDTYLFRCAGGDPDTAWQLLRAVINEAEASDAILSVLWHPNTFYEPEFPGFAPVYRKLLVECATRGAEFLTSAQVTERFAPGEEWRAELSKIRTAAYQANPHP